MFVFSTSDFINRNIYIYVYVYVCLIKNKAFQVKIQSVEEKISLSD